MQKIRSTGQIHWPPFVANATSSLSLLCHTCVTPDGRSAAATTQPLIFILFLPFLTCASRPTSYLAANLAAISITETTFGWMVRWMFVRLFCPRVFTKKEYPGTGENSCWIRFRRMNFNFPGALRYGCMVAWFECKWVRAVTSVDTVFPGSSHTV